MAIVLRLNIVIVYTIDYTSPVIFEWHEGKNSSNFRKHGVWFEEAQTVWADSGSIEFYDPEHSEDEDRFIRVGYSSASRILLVVFCERAWQRYPNHRRPQRHSEGA